MAEIKIFNEKIELRFLLLSVFMLIFSLSFFFWALTYSLYLIALGFEGW